MRFVMIIILFVILIAILAQDYFILKERDELRAKLDSLNSRLSVLLEDSAEIQSEVEYFLNPENLEKELKQRFNYKKSDEKMIIITP